MKRYPKNGAISEKVVRSCSYNRIIFLVNTVHSIEWGKKNGYGHLLKAQGISFILFCILNQYLFYRAVVFKRPQAFSRELCLDQKCYFMYLE